MLGTIKGLLVINQRKMGMRSGHHDPYGLGHTYVTMGVTKGCNKVIWSKSLKALSDQLRIIALVGFYPTN